MPLLLQHRPSGGQFIQASQGDKVIGSAANNDPWPTTSQEERPTSTSLKKNRSVKQILKSATLQPVRRSNSSNWHLEEGDLSPQQKMVKFSASNISLNNLAGGSAQNPESSYV